jgi:alpha-D-ribose 1-methylphosphonate 5-triphosphate synthase subunit PhnH
MLHVLMELVQYTYTSSSQISHLLNPVLKCSAVYDKLRFHPTCEILQQHSSLIIATLNSTEMHHF